MVVLGIPHPAATVVAAVAGFIKTFRFVSAQAAVVLRIGHTAPTIIASLHVAGFIETIGFMTAEAMIMFGVSYTAAPIVAAMARLVQTFRLVAS